MADRLYRLLTNNVPKSDKHVGPELKRSWFIANIGFSFSSTLTRGGNAVNFTYLVYPWGVQTFGAVLLLSPLYHDMTPELREWVTSQAW